MCSGLLEAKDLASPLSINVYLLGHPIIDELDLVEHGKSIIFDPRERLRRRPHVSVHAIVTEVADLVIRHAGLQLWQAELFGNEARFHFHA